MKKLITLIAGLLLVALPVGLAGCDDSDKEIYNDGRLVTDVVIPTSMTVYRGMEVSVSGYGFAQGDAIALRAGEDLPAATTVASEKLLTFVIPDGAADQTVYKVVLNRAQDYQVLGSSKMTVQLAIDVDLGKTISGNWGGDAVIRGRGFMATDKLFLEQGGKFEAPVKGADDSSLTFTIPRTPPTATANSPCSAAQKSRHWAPPNSTSPWAASPYRTRRARRSRVSSTWQDKASPTSLSRTAT